VFSTPRHQADNTSSPVPGKQDPHQPDRQVALGPAEARRDGAIEQRRREHADEHEDGDDERERRKTAPATRSASRRSPREIRDA
jgi:hypothetical protein